MPAIQAFLFALIISIGFGSKDPAWAAFLPTFFWIWFLIHTATLLGLMLSTLVDTAEKVMTIVPLILIPQVMLAGVVAKIDYIGVEILSYAIPTRWGNEGLYLIQKEIFMEIPFTQNTQSGGQAGGSLPAKTALEEQFHSSYQDIFGSLAYTIQLDIIFLSLFCLGTTFVIFWGMKKKDAIAF